MMREGDWVYVVTATPEMARKMSREGVDNMLRLEFDTAVKTTAGELDAWYAARKVENHAMPDDYTIRAVLTAEGWTVSTASFYDEEGVEGWQWHPPAGHPLERSLADDPGEVGDWGDEPAIPEELRTYVAGLGGQRR